MAHLLKKLAQKQSFLCTNRFIATLANQNHQKVNNLFPALFGNQPFLSNENVMINPNRVKDEVVGQLGKLQTYPSISFGFFVDPVLPSGLGLVGLGGPGVEHDKGVMWADSVKKKRKKKMNKHKYKKLRKRLRRKTKT